MITLCKQSHTQSGNSVFLQPTLHSRLSTTDTKAGSREPQYESYICRTGRLSKITLTLWDDGHYSIMEKNPQTQFPLNEEGSYCMMGGDSIVFLPKFQGDIDTVYESIDTCVTGYHFEFKYPSGDPIIFWRSLTIVSEEKTDYYQPKDFNGLMEKYISDPYPFHPKIFVFESFTSRKGYKNTYYPRNNNSNTFRFVIRQTLRDWEENLDDGGIRRLGIFKGRLLILDGHFYKRGWRVCDKK